MAINLRSYQLAAIDQLQTGSILCGGVGSGKSRTAIAYYLLKECQGSIKINGEGRFRMMKTPRDLYIITTAKKRDSLEWEKELANFVLCPDEDAIANAYHVKVTIDSWNNIKKYQKVVGAFFLFDEQRVVGSGAWVKAFLDIARKNAWILLSATPGDEWKDYIPVFVANGFYKNKTEFNTMHCVYSRFSKYPKIERYVGTKILERYRDAILVPMEDQRQTVRHNIYCDVDYDRELYRKVFRERWNPYENEPIQEMGKFMYLLRRVANSDESRLVELEKIVAEKRKAIVFYNFNYELEMIYNHFERLGYPIRQWNGNRHEDLPTGERWLYLVQYSAGCEGWNCITTDTIVFYSQTYSYRMLEQASGRIDRMNTPYRDLYYYHFKAGASIDLAIYSKLKNKKNFNERVFVRRLSG